MPRTAAPIVCAIMIALTSGCKRSSVPTADNVPEIMAEAAGTKSVSKFNDSPARKAVRSSFRTVLYFDSLHEAEVRKRFQTQELRSYLMLADSHVGGDFPRRIARLLREVQEANRNYLAMIESYPSVLDDELASTDLSADQKRALAAEMTQAVSARQRSGVEAVRAFDAFVDLAAQVYELTAANSRSITSMRDGLHISDDRVMQRFNALVDRANAAHAVADTAFRRANPEQQARLTRMLITKPIRK